MAKKRDVAVVTALGWMPRFLVKLLICALPRLDRSSPLKRKDQHAGGEVDREVAVQGQLPAALFGRCGFVAAPAGGFRARVSCRRQRRRQ